MWFVCCVKLPVAFCFGFVFQLRNAFLAHGYKAELNEPWSGQKGFMFAADQFSNEQTAVIMFEFRQDLIVLQEWRDKVIKVLCETLQKQGIQLTIESIKRNKK